MWIPRLLAKTLTQLSNTRPVVFLAGARQTGKSSLLQKLFPDLEYVTFDHLHHVDAAREMPDQFLRRFSGPVILDEVQYVPEIFRYLKIIVDENRDAAGRWLLTGSQQFELMSGISETMAGRISISRLETLSAKELRAQKVKGIGDHLYLGGYPELWKNRDIDAEAYFESYIRTYLERDLTQIVDVRNLVDFRRFVRQMALRAGQLVNFSAVGRDTGVSDATVRKWTHALEVSGLIYLIPPYFTNIGKRLTKTPKLYFSDHGLLSHLLGISNNNDWVRHPLRGHLWENFVLMELIKTEKLIPGQNLFFYRDQNGVEIDFIVEQKGRLTLIEAKAGETVDRRKLNFDKVVPLFEKLFDTHAVLACGVKSDISLPRKGFTAFNPLRTSIEL